LGVPFSFSQMSAVFHWNVAMKSFRVFTFPPTCGAMEVDGEE